MTKGTRQIVLIAATFAIGLMVGRFSISKNVVVYSVPILDGRFRNAVHLDWPTYGLPMAEYCMFLKLLDEGDVERLRHQLDMCLDMVLHDASFRRPELPSSHRDRLDVAIATVASYRDEHPRSVTSSFSNHTQRVDALLDTFKVWTE